MVSLMELNEGRIAQVLHFVLGCVVRRLHYRDAARLIGAVPPHLREPLLDLPAGPDKSITVFGILDGVITRFGVTEPQAQMIMSRFWSLMAEWLEPEMFDEVRGTLYNEPRSEPMRSAA